MKINLFQPIYESDGEPAIKKVTDKKDVAFFNTNGREKVLRTDPFILKDVLVALINSNGTGKPLETDEQTRRLIMMRKVLTLKEVEFTIKQVSVLQELLPNLNNSVTSLQVDEILKGNLNPLAPNYQAAELDEEEELK